MGQLVTDSRFLTASSYSSWTRSTGSEGSMHLFKEKPWAAYCQDLNVGRDAHGAHVHEYWMLADPSLSTPCSKGVLERLSNPLVGQPSNSWAIMGRRSVFSSLSLLTSAVCGPLGETNHYWAHISRGWPEVACARPMKGHGDGTRWVHGSRWAVGFFIRCLLL
jgi:hypothetical protein